MMRFHRIRSLRKMLRNAVRFFLKNGQLLFLTLLAVIGFFGGIILYRATKGEYLPFFSSLLSVAKSPVDFLSGCTAAMTASLLGCIFLTALFLFGMTPFGCPPVLLIDLLFGIIAGMIQSYSYCRYGFGFSSITCTPYLVLTGIAIVSASARAMHISCAISRQFLPNGAHCGSLWQDFKGYLWSNAIFLFLIFAASVINVLLLMAYHFL